MKTYLTIEKTELLNLLISKSIIKETFTFDELSETAQQKALDGLYGINVDYKWGESVYDDAKDIGVNITEFDIYHCSINGNLMFDIDTICDEIIKDHGEGTSTYNLASEYKTKSNAIEDNDDYDDNYDALTEEFKYEILDAYLNILREEYKYLTSKEAIIETINANQYEFNKEGKYVRI